METSTKSILFTPLNIRNVQLRNRICVSPMCQYSAVDGYANDWHLVHLGSRAAGGAGIVFCEATAVTPEGRISPSDLGLWKDSHIEPLKRITEFAKKMGAIPGIQLAHSGRKGSTAAPWKGGGDVPLDEGGWLTSAPSAIPFSLHNRTPLALDKNGIESIKKAFFDATKRALLSGFQIIEIHAAHGYLFHEFLSPLSNHRSDNYGGSFENRIRLLCEVTVGIRKIIPTGMPLFVRVSATDWIEGGWDIAESIKLAQKLKALEVDLIDTSSGALIPGVKIPIGHGYQVPFAARIRAEADIMTGAVGLITDPLQAEKVLREESADIVFIAREFLRDPYWPHHAASVLGTTSEWPIPYGYAIMPK